MTGTRELSRKEQEQLGMAVAIVNKVQSTRDGGFRVTLDLPDNEIKVAQVLMEKLATGNPMVVITVMNPEESN